MAQRPHGVPPTDLSDDDLRREVAHLHETRSDTLHRGSESALQAHTERMLALEQELLRRLPAEAAPDPARTRAGSRAGAGQPVPGRDLSTTSDPGPDADPDPEPALDVSAVIPEYGGSADVGVVSSVGEHDPAAGDVVDVVRSEHRKLEGVFEELLRLADDGELDGLRVRWGGVVRELLEHEAAQHRVVLPAVEQVAGTGAVSEVRTRQQELMDRLLPYDELNAEVAPDEVRACIEAATAHLRTVDDVVVPLLQRLPADERMRLGEDLRQVTG